MEGATIPRIARHAGLTSGSVYRRFQDKDALLETAILEILQRQEETMETSFRPLVTTKQISLPEFAAKIIYGMVAAYRANAGLLRGMRQFAQRRVKTTFGKRASYWRRRTSSRPWIFFCPIEKKFGIQSHAWPYRWH
jgi:AcrR family transcriptional regulator